MTPKTAAIASFAAVIVAAGKSARLGQPKQLLTVDGKTLIVRTVEATLSAGACPVVVVLGAYEDRIRNALTDLPVVIVSNPHWATGMGSSIGIGIAYVAALTPPPDAVLIAVCDQPHFRPEVITALRVAYRTPSSIVAARYAGRFGVPVIFGSDYFEKLKALHGDQGARQLLDDNATHVIGAECPELATDLDTWEDYQKLSDNRTAGGSHLST